MYGNFEVKTGTVGPGAPIVDVTREALLAAIEINGGDALAGFHQGDGDMQGGGGFTRSTLLVAQHNDVSRAGLTLTSLHQHASTPCDIFKFRATAVKLNAYSRTQIILRSVFMLNRTHHASRRRWLHDSANSYRGRLLLFECHPAWRHGTGLDKVSLPPPRQTPPTHRPHESNSDVAKPNDRPHDSRVTSSRRRPSREKSLNRAGADHGSAPRRPCVAGSAGETPRPKGRRVDLRQPSAVCPVRRFRIISAHLEGRCRQACGRGRRPDLEPRRQDDVPGWLCHPDSHRRAGHCRS